MKVYFDEFSNEEDMLREFGITSEQLEGVDVLYASYDRADYEGWANVIFRKEGKLYEVNGSHCSCYGLEDQWEPEETTVKALLSRPNVAKVEKERLELLSEL